MSTYIENLEWRYATKQFDSSKKISSEDLETLKKALQLSASSYGLQPYEILIIENPEVRAKLKEAAYNQTQLTDASQVIVFAAKTDVTAEDVATYMKNISETRNVSIEDLAGFSGAINGAIVSLPQEHKAIWAAKQCYIALGNLLSAAAALNIDACPMEGFSSEQFDEILGLEEKGLATAVIATIGYRSENDLLQHATKVRKSAEELFITI
ncbi:NAD(P)H-dependent oxidoreductase [Neptunitalea chrysea]|uniref:NAD(P)H-dependent oxidoreductase n=1 Tax=Neptunitalea chrysea TaxID=1647581 RepID=A0A9W6B5A0_9FLAO|nr:NAD(P)H-dependent oxidoreductase [Neptunitalea chrysea]GLB52127.1 NAD(P)H-dependent oxidoreductase [Neptunitalea chrysea]